MGLVATSKVTGPPRAHVCIRNVYVLNSTFWPFFQCVFFFFLSFLFAQTLGQGRAGQGNGCWAGELTMGCCGCCDVLDPGDCIQHVSRSAVCILHWTDPSTRVCGGENCPTDTSRFSVRIHLPPHLLYSRLHSGVNPVHNRYAGRWTGAKRRSHDELSDQSLHWRGVLQ